MSKLYFILTTLLCLTLGIAQEALAAEAAPPAPPPCPHLKQAGAKCPHLKGSTCDCPHLKAGAKPGDCPYMKESGCPHCKGDCPGKADGAKGCPCAGKAGGHGKPADKQPPEKDAKKTSKKAAKPAK